MSRVAKFTRKKNKALSIFEKTRKSLLRISEEINVEQAACHARVVAYQEAIKAEKVEHEALGQELASISKTVGNIDSILG